MEEMERLVFLKIVVASFFPVHVIQSRQHRVFNLHQQNSLPSSLALVSLLVLPSLLFPVIFLSTRIRTELYLEEQEERERIKERVR